MTRQSLLRIIVTLGILLLAIVLAHALWRDYMYAPWTRDGRVRAQVINIAPDVSGLVAEVHVIDNQRVKRGDVLFVIDPERFRDALAQAEAEVARSEAQVALARAQLAQRHSESVMRSQQVSRRAQLSGEVITAEAKSDISEVARQALAAEDAAKASLNAATAGHDAALSARQTARLNLERSVVRAPVDGFIANLNLYAGDYVSVGMARMALIDANSFWVYGYFEETKIPGVHVNDAAEVRLMAGHVVLHGRVESIASGIADRDNPSSANLLADVNPVFTWVRLAQRVPVRIALDAVPDDVHLAAGMTCTVTIHATRRDVRSSTKP
ncbi:biotin/lipoyl-binding protein [Dyella japonica]|uniref:Membrane protein n=1 Tax=Dyella japonica A8 TaxID=1217721 RepID=A0A075K7Y9_9GAMM|nr:HlyD family secretion protein [Dyella japonica]AIF48283.1 membrane protein [Dyella japonica A8]